MDRSLFRTLLGATLFSAMFISGAHAQDVLNSFTPTGKEQVPLAAAVSFNEGSLDNQPGDFNVCLLKSPPRFETTAALLFLQPSSGNLVYSTLVNPFPFPSPSWSDQAIRPDFSPAFNVGLRYFFGSGGDIQVNWTHLNSDDTASAHASTAPVNLGAQLGTFTEQALGPAYLIGPPPPFTSASAVAHFGYDAVNLDAGLWLSAGNHVQMRIFGGLQIARINQSLTTHFLSPDGSIAFTDVSQSVFSGVGPRLGTDVHYVAGKFDFLCGIAGFLLMGGMQSSRDFFTTAPLATAAGLVPNGQSLSTPNVTRVIPGIDARLGAGYAIPVGNFGVLRCELGYQAAAYIGAVNQFSMTEVENMATSTTEGTQAVFLRTAVESQSNFFVHGPFGKFTFQF